MRAGTVRSLERRASFVLAADGVLLAGGAGNDGNGDAWTGMGVAAYTREGGELWRVLGDEPVSWLQAAGGYAYVAGLPEPYPPTVRVIELATGAVRTVRAELPFFVAP